MNDVNITKEEVLAIYPKVAEIIADAIACEVEKVKLDSSLVENLGAESIDFVDIVFRLQQHFKVKIPRGKVIEDARGALTEAEFEKGGVVSEAGAARLRAFLSEVPADRFKTPLNTSEIPKLFTVETFCKMVIRQQKAAAPRPA